MPFEIPNSDKNFIVATGGSHFVAASKDRTNLIEMGHEDLDSCQKLGSTYFCQTLVQRRRIADSSCVISIFRRKLDQIANNCHLKIVSDEENAIRINAFTTFIQTPAQRIFFKCADTNGTVDHYSQQLSKGLFIIESPPERDCQFTSQILNFRSYSPLDETIALESVEITVDIEKILNVTKQQLQDLQ